MANNYGAKRPHTRSVSKQILGKNIFDLITKKAERKIFGTFIKNPDYIDVILNISFLKTRFTYFLLTTLKKMF